MSNENEYASPLENLPQTVTHTELRADNLRRWQQGAPDLAAQMTNDQPEPGMPQPGAEPEAKAVTS